MAKRSFHPFAAAPDSAPSAEAHTSRTLTEQTYSLLREDIIEGRLAPGSKLRIEHLRTQYGIGAGTLREALTRLVSDALVSTEGQRGFSVTPIAMSDLEDITRLRVHIETDALRQSILKKAFSGQLVAQDKNDEPATALLERIRAGKSNGMSTPRNRRKSG